MIQRITRFATGVREAIHAHAHPALALLLLLAGCNSATTYAAKAAPDDSFAPYPPAPGRLLSWDERDKIVLFVSHIVISYDGAAPDALFRPLDWAPDEHATRTREAARALAIRVQAEAAEHPENFGELARQYSDDAVTRGLGGSLGGVRSTQLPEEYLDALTALRPGGVSRIIRGTWGFHILLRRAPPLKEDVAARRIVIRYAHTMGGVDAAPARSHEEARKLAETVVASARAGDAPFPELVTRYSEHADRAYGGDMGVYSTVDPEAAEREVEVLARSRFDEVADPIDSIWGFEVVQRVEASPRPRYAMASIRLKVRPGVGADDPLSIENATVRARELLRKLHEAPASFTELQKQNESEGVSTWELGHGSPELSIALDKLRFGEIGTEPVRLPYQLIIPMRLDPALVQRSTPSLAYELPLRVAPDLADLFRAADGAPLAGYLGGFTRPEVASELRLTESEWKAVLSAFATLQKTLPAATKPDERVRLYEETRRSLHRGMSEAGYGRFISFVGEEAARLMLAHP